jgi:hypothetical protein
MVVNLEASNRPGSHWVALHFPTRSKVLYFDPYGEPPPKGPIRSYLEQFDRVVVYPNPFVVQSLISSVCADYCIYFVHQCAAGRSYEEILARLGRAGNPDAYVKTFTAQLL